MIALIDLNGGEFPIGREITRIEQLPYLIMRIAKLMVDIKPHLQQKQLSLSYGFSVRSEYKKTLEVMISDIESEGLPTGSLFYKTDGKAVFEFRGPTGGIATSVVCYLVVP